MNLTETKPQHASPGSMEFKLRKLARTERAHGPLAFPTHPIELDELISEEDEGR